MQELLRAERVAMAASNFEDSTLPMNMHTVEDCGYTLNNYTHHIYVYRSYQIIFFPPECPQSKDESSMYFSVKALSHFHIFLSAFPGAGSYVSSPS